MGVLQTPKEDTSPVGYRARLSILSIVVAVLALSACAKEGSFTPDPFEKGVSVTAVVSENVTACVVDAVCTLRLDFADTTVVAVYGTGDRDGQGCEIDTQVSDVAFELSPGIPVAVVLLECAGVGLVVDQIRRVGQ